VKALHHPIGVLIMAYGGPNSLEELPGYLADIRQGRPTAPAVLSEIRHNYKQIGGKSPLLEVSTRQARAVAEQLDGQCFRVYLGMRHWAPWIEDVVGQTLDDGITHAISIALTPHFSQFSVAKYQAKIAQGMEMYRGHIEFEHVASYFDAPKLIEAFANRVRLGMEMWPKSQRDSVHVILSAHSLPKRVLEMGDPYDAQVRQTAALVADAACLPSHQWSWSYQSAGRSPEPWLGPQLTEQIPKLAAQEIRNVIIVPIGFVSDHVEILYDIDIQAQQVAREWGVRLERPPALNEDPLLIETLKEQICQRADRLLTS